MNNRYLFWSATLYSMSTLIGMAPMNIGAALFGITLLAHLHTNQGIAQGFLAPLKNKTIRYFIFITTAFAALLALSYIGPIYTPLNICNTGEPPFSFWWNMVKVWYIFLPWIVVVGLSQLNQQQRYNLLKAWFLAFFVFSIIGTAQLFTGWPHAQKIPVLKEYNLYHANMFLGHHLILSSIWIFPFFVLLDILTKKWAKVRKHKALIYTLLFFGFTTLIFSFSRMLWISLPLGIFAFVIFKLKRNHALIFIIFSLASLAALTQHPFIQKRINSSHGVNQRYDLWKNNFELFKRRPVLGVGWRLGNPYVAKISIRNSIHKSIHLGENRSRAEKEAYAALLYTPSQKEALCIEKHPNICHEKPGVCSVFAAHAHNNFIESLTTTGVLGTSIWLLFAFWGIYMLWLTRKNPYNFSFGLLCAFLVYHLNGLTEVNLWHGKVLHSAMWMTGWAMLFLLEKDPFGIEDKK